MIVNSRRLNQMMMVNGMKADDWMQGWSAEALPQMPGVRATAPPEEGLSTAPLGNVATELTMVNGWF